MRSTLFHACTILLSSFLFAWTSFDADTLNPPPNRDRNCTGIASIMECLSQATIDPNCQVPITPRTLAGYWQRPTGCIGLTICGKLKLQDGTVVEVTDPRAIDAAGRLISDSYKICAAKEQDPNLPRVCDKIPESIPNGQCVSFAGSGTDRWPDGSSTPTLHAINICKDANGKVYIQDSSCDPTKIDVPPAVVGAGSASYPCKYNGSDLAKRGKTSQRSYPSLGLCTPTLRQCFERNGVKVCETAVPSP